MRKNDENDKILKKETTVLVMKFLKTLPGILLSFVIAAISLWIESLFPIHIIGASVIAMFIGIVLNSFLSKT